MLKKLAIIGLIFSICGVAFGYEGRHVQGQAGVANGSADATVIAAPNSGTAIKLKSAVCSVEVIAVGAGGEVALENGVGGTRIFQADADALGVYNVDFGEEGYILSSATLLNVTVDGAATTQATASCTAVGEVIS